ncbi:MAG: YhjD/YihY/BrkB family envelope integrity protein [Acidimicrobiales bacterium]
MATQREDATRTARWRARGAQILANRAVSIPTLTFRRFFAIDGMRKSMLLAFNLFICVIPLMIMAFAVIAPSRRHLELGQVMVEQFRLHGLTARIMRGAFPPNEGILKVASIIVAVSFAISGFDVGSIFERTFAEAWGVKPYGGWRGPVRGGLWFVLVFGTFGFSQFLQAIPARHGRVLYAAVIPIILVMNYLFWLITPRLLLDKQLDPPDLRPGAVMGMLASTVLWRLSAVILPGWFDWYGRGFGAIGIGLALLSWTYVVAVVWVVIVVASAAYWERTATVEEVLEATEDGPGLVMDL